MLGSRILKTARLIRGLTQDEVAATYGVHSTTYQRWERGESAVSYDDVVGLCEGVFHIPLFEIMQVAKYAQ